MITKTGEMLVKQALMEKRGVDPVTAAILAVGLGIGGHVGQNIAGNAILKNPQKSGLLQMALRGFFKPNKGMSTVGGNIAYGAAEAAMPEVGMLYEKSSGVGKRVGETLAKHNITMDKLPRRHAAVLGLLGQGRFRDAHRMANTPETREMLAAYMEKAFPGTGIEHLMGITPALSGQAGNRALAALRKELPEELLTKENINKILENFEKAYQETSFGKALSGALKSDGAKMVQNALRGDDNIINQAARGVTNGAVRIGLFTQEPGIGVFNEGKRFMDWKAARVVPGVGKIQDWASEKLVKKPIRDNFQLGLSGKETPRYSPSAKKNAVDLARKEGGTDAAKLVAKEYNKDRLSRYGINVFSNEMSHLSNQAGLILDNAGFRPEHIETLKNIAPKVQTLHTAYHNEMQASKQLARQAEQQTRQKAIQEETLRRNQEYVNNSLKRQQTGQPILDSEKEKLLGNSIYDFRPVSERVANPAPIKKIK